MRVWIDLANSPHVALFEPIVERLKADGADVTLTVRDHAQTLELAIDAFGGESLLVVGGSSPAGRFAKARTIAGRARALHRYARDAGPTWRSRMGPTLRSWRREQLACRSSR